MTWIGVHNAIISTAHHAKGLKFNLFFIIGISNISNQVKTMRKCDFIEMNVMFAVLMKTLYALIQQHNDPCLY